MLVLSKMFGIKAKINTDLKSVKCGWWKCEFSQIQFKSGMKFLIAIQILKRHRKLKDQTEN